MSDAPASNASASNISASNAPGTDAPVNNGSVSNEQAVFQKLADGLATQLIGHESLIERLLIALLSGGHVLLEGPPGVAKTRTINCFADLLDLTFVRIQSTPDLLPADITGTDIYQQQSGDFRFLSGPLFNNVVLVDEVNRAPPKVQSALLEAMGENQVTTGGLTRALPEPFLVAATQNPIEYEGTYPLPEAQLDRFMFFINLVLPEAAHERQILDHVLNEKRDGTTSKPMPTANAELVAAAQAAVQKVHLSDAVRDYIVRLVTATRGHGAGGAAANSILQAASPRASIFLASGAQAKAWLDGRDYVVPDDVSSLASDVLAGRIALDYQARAAGSHARDVIAEILESTPRV